jgi:hypothetical protein
VESQRGDQASDPDNPFILCNASSANKTGIFGSKEEFMATVASVSESLSGIMDSLKPSKLNPENHVAVLISTLVMCH